MRLKTFFLVSFLSLLSKAQNTDSQKWVVAITIVGGMDEDPGRGS